VELVHTAHGDVSSVVCVLMNSVMPASLQTHVRSIADSCVYEGFLHGLCVLPPPCTVEISWLLGA